MKMTPKTRMGMSKPGKMMKMSPAAEEQMDIMAKNDSPAMAKQEKAYHKQFGPDKKPVKAKK